MGKKEVIKKLLDGEVVENYKEGGNSMVPLIHHMEPVTLKPVDTSKLERGDIVLVKVKGNIYTHKVLGRKKNLVQIGNNKGGVNGWTHLKNVYGIVTEVNGRIISGAEAKVKHTRTVKVNVTFRAEFEVDKTWSNEALCMLAKHLLRDEVPGDLDVVESAELPRGMEEWSVKVINTEVL